MSWLVARVRSNAEHGFAERVEGTGQETFVPTVTTLSRPSGMRFPVKVQRPRFLGYLFVKADTARYLDPVYEDSRFNGFLRVANVVATVTDQIVKDLRAWDGCEVTPAEKPKMPFKDGDMAKVKDGPLGGMRGIVSLGNEGRLSLNHYDFTVSVEFRDLSLLESYVLSAA